MKILKTSEPYYSQIESGKKIYDGRANDSAEKYWNMGLNESLIFQLVDEKGQALNKSLSAEIKSLRKYHSVEDACDSIDFKKLIPDANSVDDVVKAYSSFPGYPDRIKKYGFIVIELKGVKNEAS